MRRTIAVSLGETAQPAGTLYYDAQGSRESAAFEYLADWLASDAGYAIAPPLRLVAGPQFHGKARGRSVFHAPIADTEPDGWAKNVILRDHAKRRQAAKRSGEPVSNESLNSLDFLLAVDDASRVGALRFQDETGTFCKSFDEHHRRTPPLLELAALYRASRAVELHAETLADLEYLRGRGTSLGGLRPKCTVIDDDGHLAIGKFPSVDDQRSVTKGEVLALRLARRAGIEAADASIIDSDGAAVAIIRRFDRGPGGRIMYISAATMLDVDVTAPGEHTYTEIVDAIRAYGSEAQRDIEELFRRIAFSVLITNVDDHLMNHGFLHVQHGQWRLAPAFDVNPFPDRARELKTWISEDTGPEAAVDSLLSVSPYFRLSARRAAAIVTEVNDAIDGWRENGRALGMSESEIEQFEDAFEHRERNAARRVR